MSNLANIRILFAFRFFSSLIPAYVIERLFWEERGMTIQMVVYAEIIYALTIVLLEVPTGMMADRWGRKRMMVASALLGCSEFVILLFATEFWHFAVVVFLAGIGRSASSGTENALLYDTLQLQGKASSFEKQLGRLNACDLVAAILAALSGSWLAARFDLELNYWLSFGSALIALMLSMLLVEPKAAEGGEGAAAGDKIPFKRYVTESLRFFRQNPDVRLVVLSGMVTGTAMVYLYEFWQLYANRLEVPVVFFGALSTAIMLLQLPGSLLAHALAERIGRRTLLIGITAVFVIGFAYAAVSRDVAGMAAMLVVCLFSGVMEPVVSGYLHHRTGSATRATIDSFQSLGANLVSMLAGLGFGLFSARYDVFGGYGFIALLCGIFLVWLIAARRSIAR
ncbi:MFS transporter [Paenibacillus cisolokensis]|uniref:MFS transporter n=1 Tax=Paenibacillus cisolokensis TaxID=1658519 RepID=UPI003D271F8D